MHKLRLDSELLYDLLKEDEPFIERIKERQPYIGTHELQRYAREACARADVD